MLNNHIKKRPFYLTLFVCLLIVGGFSNAVDLLAQETTAEPPTEASTTEAPPDTPEPETPEPQPQPVEPEVQQPVVPEATDPPQPIETQTPEPVATEPVTAEAPAATEIATAGATAGVTAAPPVEATDIVTAAPTEEATGEVAVTATVAATEESTEAATAEATTDLTPTPLPAEPPLILLFSDVFDSGALYLWTVGAGWSLTPSEGGQAMQVIDSEAPLTYVHSNLFNMAAQARIQLNAGTARLNLQESVAGSYSVTLDMNGTVTLYRGGNAIASAQVSASTPGQWRTLRLSAIEGVLRVAVDGTEVIATFDDAPLPPGTLSFAALGSGSSPMLVDDVSVWQVGGNAALQLAEATAEALTPEMSILSFQNFDDGTPRQWSRDYHWSIEPDETGNALKVGVWAGHAIFAGEALANVAVETRFKLDKGLLAITTHQSAAGSYLLTVHESGDVKLYRNDAELQTTTVPMDTTSWHTLVFYAVAGDLRVTVDDVEVITLTDSDPLPEGRILFSRDHVDIGAYALDDITVRVPTVEMSQMTLPQMQLAPAAAPSQQTLALPETFELANEMSFGRVRHVDNDGTIRTVWAANEAHDWSPEGGRIASVLNVDAGQFASIRITPLEINGDFMGSTFEIVQTMSGTIVNCLSWAPDGNHIAFYSTGSVSGLHLVNLEDQSRDRLMEITPITPNQCPVFSPVANEIAFISDGDLYRYDVANYDPNDPEAAAEQLAEGLIADAADIGWSPDGSQIAFAADGAFGGDASDIYYINRDDTGLTLVTSDSPDGPFFTDVHPTWSPDGSHIAFNRLKPSLDPEEVYYNIHIVDLTGTEPITGILDSGFILEADAVWSPDGSWIAFADATEPRTMHIVSPDGTPPYDVESGVHAFGARWQPPNQSTNPCASQNQAQIISTVQSFGVIITNNSRNWTLSEMQAICDGVHATADAFHTISTQTPLPTPSALFSQVMGPIYFIRDQTSPTGTTGFCVTDNPNKTITCYGDLVQPGTTTQIPITEYTIVHELGHIFDPRVGLGGSVTIVWDGNNETVNRFTEIIDAGVFVLGDCGTAGNIGVIMGNGNANRWPRGERGWGSGPSQQPNNQRLITDFQQNPLQTALGVAHTDVVEEAVADMFLNWVYRLPNGLPPQNVCQQINPVVPGNWNGFLNLKWTGVVSATPTSGAHDFSLPGDNRFKFMHDTVLSIFSQKGW